VSWVIDFSGEWEVYTRAVAGFKCCFAVSLFRAKGAKNTPSPQSKNHGKVLGDPGVIFAPLA